MTKLGDIMDLGDLANAMDAGLVKAQYHPSLPLAIHNYTAEAQFTKGAWDNPAVRLCRGLITDTHTDEIIARPFPKFFNYGQGEAPVISVTEQVTVLDKLDGSLGILYPTEWGLYSIATRGSFDSEQAREATHIWRTKYQNNWHPPVTNINDRHEWTTLFEIIYPENRIVVDYGDMRDLVLLAFVNIHTGAIHPATWSHGYPGPVAECMPYETLGEALAAPPRPNAEGLVVTTWPFGEMVKIKQDDYVELHRIVTGLSEKVIWEHLSTGGHIKELLAKVPDEFHDWMMAVNTRLLAEHSIIRQRAITEFSQIKYDLAGEKSRKAFAMQAKTSPDAPLLFMLYDNKPIDDAIWKRLKPVGDTRIFARGEDVA